MIGVALSLAAATVTPANVTLGGVGWQEGLAPALVQARELNRPVLHLQMMGRLDDAFC